MLIDRHHILTCAHVVQAACGLVDSEDAVHDVRILVDFPGTSRDQYEATVVPGEFKRIEPDGSGDVATLRLISPAPAEISAAPVRAPRSTVGHDCRVLGFPRGNPNGRWAVGTLRGAAGPDWSWQQFDEPGIARVEPGYSGAPVWDDSLKCVIGLIVARDKERNVGASYLIPTRMLETVSASLRDVLAAQGDPRADSQWKFHYRGIESRDLRGDYFTGRIAALTRLASWIAGEDSGEDKRAAVCIVTGSPGSGKSAILARLTVLADRYVRSTTSGAELLNSSPRAAVPEEGCVQAALNLSGRTLSEVAAALADAFGHAVDGNGHPRKVAGDAVDGILDALSRWASVSGNSSTQSHVIVLDSLDEASDSAEIVSELVLPLTTYRAAQAGIKVLIGVRGRYLPRDSRRIDPAELIPGLTSALVLNLDSEALTEPADIFQYSLDLLLLRGEPAPLSPYRDSPELAQRLAEAITRRAYPNYLVAQLVSLSFVEHDYADDLKELTVSLEHLPATVDQAFEGYLRQFGSEEQRARDLLAPLAWTADPQASIPRDGIWIDMANEISGEHYTQADLRWLLRSPAAAFLVEETAGALQVGYRLYHSALAEYLRGWQQVRERETAASVNQRIVTALLRSVPSSGSSSDERLSWPDAPVYVTEYLAVHAARAVMLDDFIKDPSFIVTSNFDRLMQGLPDVRSPEGKRAAEVLRLAAYQLRSCAPSQRLSYLQLMALRYGHTEMAQSITALNAEMPWRARWAHSRQLHSTLKVSQQREVADIAVVEHENRLILLSASQAGSLHVCDLLTGRRIFPDLDAGQSIRSMTAIFWRDHLFAFTLGDDGLSIIDINDAAYQAHKVPVPFAVDKHSTQWINVCIVGERVGLFYGNKTGTWRHDLSTHVSKQWPDEESMPSYYAADICLRDDRLELLGIAVSENDNSDVTGGYITAHEISTGQITHRVPDKKLYADRLAAISDREGLKIATMSSFGRAIEIYRVLDGGHLGSFRLEIDEAPVAVCAVPNDMELDLISAHDTGVLQAWTADTPYSRERERSSDELRYHVAMVAAPNLAVHDPGGAPRNAFFVACSSSIAFGYHITFKFDSTTEFKALAIDNGEVLPFGLTLNRGVSAMRFTAPLATAVVLGTIYRGPLIALTFSAGQIGECDDASGVTCMASDYRDGGALVLTASSGPRHIHAYEFDETGFNQVNVRTFDLPGARDRAVSLSLVFVRGSRKVAAAFADMPSIVSVYDYQTLEGWSQFDLGLGCSCSAMYGFNEFLCCGTTDGRVLVFNAEAGLLLREIEVGFMPTDLALLPLSTLLVTGVADILRIDFSVTSV